MGAVRMRVQTADKNIIIIHTTPVHQLTSCEVKCFVRNKSIKAFLASNCCFQRKFESSVLNNTSSNENVLSQLFLHSLPSFSLHSTFTDWLWIIVMFFISCLNSHSDGTHSLQRIYWWEIGVIINFSKSFLMIKIKLICILDGKFPVYFHFWINYSFYVWRSDCVLKS